MEEFLIVSKDALADLSLYQKTRVVLGNRSCDLDSAVCALVQGLIEYLDVKKHNENQIAVIPVMNIVEREFHIKTEVVYCLKKYAVPIHLLTFRDQIDLARESSTRRLELILVDHHDLAKEDELLTDSVTEIIDHRPQNRSWPWTGKKLNLQMVGSCSTLVARNLLFKHPDAMTPELASLLRGRRGRMNVISGGVPLPVAGDVKRHIVGKEAYVRSLPVVTLHTPRTSIFHRLEPLASSVRIDGDLLREIIDVIDIFVICHVRRRRDTALDIFEN